VSYSDAVVAQAKLWVGYREGAGNQNMFSAGLHLPAEAWCQDFVQFISAAAGYRQPHTTSGVVNIGDWAREHGLFIETTDATPGCQILYDLSNGDGREPADILKTHTGIYIGGSQVIAGNTTMPGQSDGVYKKSVELGAKYLWGAINWPAYWKTHPEPYQTSLNNFPSYAPLQKDPQLRKDDRVIGLQRALGDVLGTGLTVDGQFGDDTAKAVIRFQQTRHLAPANGEVTQATWAALDIEVDKLRK
jgi:hypothetical protein